MDEHTSLGWGGGERRALFGRRQHIDSENVSALIILLIYMGKTNA